jgi:hypothetical protein
MFAGQVLFCGSSAAVRRTDIAFFRAFSSPSAGHHHARLESSALMTPAPFAAAYPAISLIGADHQ